MNYCDRCETETSDLTRVRVDDAEDGWRTEEWCDDCITGSDS